MASVNKVILIGNLGNDPEMRHMNDGTAVATLSIATTDTWKDKNGEKQEKTEWHRVVMYRKLAEIAGEYLKKGRSVYIEARLKTGKWTDKQGIERYTTNIIATDLKMLGSKPNGQQSESNSTTSKAGAVSGNDGGFDGMDDDIPF
ncbi:MAG: single-stranded DNA-binding protein [Proteobacteria bacterium]|nr:single-stranded DNA-binding protein [Pseudomonadota bacterium]